MSETKTFKEATRDLTTSQKIGYIWDYYKFYIIGTLILLVIATMFFIGKAGQKESALNVYILGDLVDSNKIAEIQQQLNEELLTEDELTTMEVKINILPYAPNALDPSIVIAALQRVSAEITAEGIDVIFIDKNQFELMTQDHYFYSLDEFLSEKGSNEGYYFNEGNNIVGIELTSIPLFSEGIKDSNVMMGVLTNSPHLETVEKFLNYIINK